MKRYRCTKDQQLEEFTPNECPFCGFKGAMSYTERCRACRLWLSFCPICQNIICLSLSSIIGEGSKTFSFNPLRLDVDIYDEPIRDVTGKIFENNGKTVLCVTDIIHHEQITKPRTRTT